MVKRSHISQGTRHLLGLEDDEDELAFTRSDTCGARLENDSKDVKNFVEQLKKFDAFKV